MELLRNSRKVLLHPLDFFYDLQFDSRAKWRHAAILLVLMIVVHMLRISWTGYSFEGRESYQVSFLFESFWILVPWVTWCISNWAVSAILDGEGKFKDIVVSSAYALLPYIVLSLPLALLSQALTQGEETTYYGIYTFIQCWVIFLFLVKVKILHDFELGKMIWIILLSLIGMLVIWFVGFLIFGLVNQAVEFVIGIVKEVQFRL
ncbi:YIP1 family protein [Paenibacillaceae bacterium]|nr:YIP1 family protein [Paenibacillaceae bacterium]